MDPVGHILEIFEIFGLGIGIGHSGRLYGSGPAQGFKQGSGSTQKLNTNLNKKRGIHIKLCYVLWARRACILVIKGFKIKDPDPGSNKRTSIS
mgnify:CR=1 FL=1